MKSLCHMRPCSLALWITSEFRHLLAIRSVSQKFISQIHVTPISGPAGHQTQYIRKGSQRPSAQVLPRTWPVAELENDIGRFGLGTVV
jgi:hypothetical protein